MTQSAAAWLDRERRQCGGSGCFVLTVDGSGDERKRAEVLWSEASDAAGGPREGEVSELCLSPAQATNKGKKISMLWRYFNAFQLSTFFDVVDLMNFFLC